MVENKIKIALVFFETVCTSYPYDLAEIVNPKCMEVNPVLFEAHFHPAP